MSIWIEFRDFLEVPGNLLSLQHPEVAVFADDSNFDTVLSGLAFFAGRLLEGAQPVQDEIFESAQWVLGEVILQVCSGRLRAGTDGIRLHHI